MEWLPEIGCLPAVCRLRSSLGGPAGEAFQGLRLPRSASLGGNRCQTPLLGPPLDQWGSPFEDTLSRCDGESELGPGFGPTIPARARARLPSAICVSRTPVWIVCVAIVHGTQPLQPSYPTRCYRRPRRDSSLVWQVPPGRGPPALPAPSRGFPPSSRARRPRPWRGRVHAPSLATHMRHSLPIPSPTSTGCQPPATHSNHPHSACILLLELLDRLA